MTALVSRSRLLAGAGLAATLLLVGGMVALRSHDQEPSCPGSPAAPITSEHARAALSQHGFDVLPQERSELCGDRVVAVLATDRDRERTRLTCSIWPYRLFHPNTVSELPPTADGAVHLVVLNVECFLSDSAGRVEELRTALKSL